MNTLNYKIWAIFSLAKPNLISDYIFLKNFMGRFPLMNTAFRKVNGISASEANESKLRIMFTMFMRTCSNYLI